MITSLKILAAVAAIGGMAAMSQPAKADHVRVGVGLGLNFVAPTYITPAYVSPGYVAPIYTPAYVPAPVVSYAAPAVVAGYGPATYYYPQPAYYYPPTVVYPAGGRGAGLRAGRFVLLRRRIRFPRRWLSRWRFPRWWRFPRPPVSLSHE